MILVFCSVAVFCSVFAHIAVVCRLIALSSNRSFCPGFGFRVIYFADLISFDSIVLLIIVCLLASSNDLILFICVIYLGFVVLVFGEVLRF